MAEMYQDRSQIGERIEELRKVKGLTQAQLAEMLSVQRNLVNYWENGERDIRSHQIVVLADCFGVSCDYLLRGVKAENLEINARLGLSDKAIGCLEYIKTRAARECGEEKSRTPKEMCAFNLTVVDVLDYMLSNGEGATLLKILEYAKLEVQLADAAGRLKPGETYLGSEMVMAEYNDPNYVLNNTSKDKSGKLLYSVPAEYAKLAFMNAIKDSVKEFTLKFTGAQLDAYKAFLDEQGED